MKTIQELVDARARKLDEIDVIVNTAKEAKRSMTPEERAQHDALVVEVEGEGGFDEQIRTATADQDDAIRVKNQEASSRS
jgi:hypothetical protein